MEEYKIVEMKKTEFGILAYLQNVKSAKIGGRKIVFTAYNGTEEACIKDMKGYKNAEGVEVPPTVFDLDPKFIVDGTPYVNKNGKTITPKWYKVV